MRSDGRRRILSRWVGRCRAWTVLMCLFAMPVEAVESPNERLYNEPDPAAAAIKAPPGMQSKLRAMINATLRKNPRNVPALVHRAYSFLNAGDTERAIRDFDAAAAAVEPASDYERHLLWSRGWANYDMDRYEEALHDWQRAAQLHGGHPFWLPYSYALLYWTMDEKEVALDWFDAAVASTPEWGIAEGMEGRIRHWRPRQQQRMRELFATWLARQGDR